MAARARKTPPPTFAVAQSDEELLKQARRGSRDAYQALVKRHHPLVLSVCHRRVDDLERALELAQDVFLDLHRSLADLPDEVEVRVWLVRTAVDRCVEEVRSPEHRVWRRLVEPLEGAGAPGASDAEPDRPLISREREKLLRRLIGELPETLREPFLLRQQEGMEYEEIAAVLEIQVGAARMRVHRARERLLERLEAEEG